MLRSRATPSSIPAVPLTELPAKTYLDATGIWPGRTVEDHCTIVGEVAKALIRRYPKELQSIFPVGAEMAAASHDIGKISPTFYEKIRQACTVGGLPVLSTTIDPAVETAWGGHAGVSQATAFALGAPKYVPEILGMHHGSSPQLGGKNALAEPFGGQLWQYKRVELVQALQTALNATWPELRDEAQARVVAGLTSVADWIGSGQHFENPNNAWDQSTIERAVEESGFVAPSYTKKLGFRDIFQFDPHPAQTTLIESVTAPGVYVLEAPMGMGKTEAALYAAYSMLEQGKASGVYFALPTQLTSNKIYERFNIFLERILDAKCPHKKALLLHGGAWLVETEMGEEGKPGGSWFDHAKRGLLAPFAVGTIDQALMATMSVKHGFVRSFGLAGKVVILDEVHTYDAYTGTLLDALIGMLRSLQCTVIVLSATLSQARRSQFVGKPVSNGAYPLITAVQNEQAVQEVVVTPPLAVTVALQRCFCDANAVDEVLKRAEAGQQVLWLENTVFQAQEQYQLLAARAHDLGIECGLLHSRFTATDRNMHEAKWVRLYGKDGWAARGLQGRILVGTQVLEQSLDIDADFLVTRFAPSDMLLQRLGRLWRHAQTPRAVEAVREAWLLAPAFEDAVENPKKAFGPSASVYAPYVLCRSLQQWENLQQIVLPGDIRGIIEATYADRDETTHMARWLHELEHGTTGPMAKKGRVQLQQLARVGLSTVGSALPEERAQTRYSESDTCSVLLVKRMDNDLTQQVTKIICVDGQKLQIPHKKNALSKKEWKQLTAELVKHMVTVGAYIAPKPLTMVHAKELGLSHCFYLGEPSGSGVAQPSLLHLAILNSTSQLQGFDGTSLHSKWRLNYRADLGYSYTSI